MGEREGGRMEEERERGECVRMGRGAGERGELGDLREIAKDVRMQGWGEKRRKGGTLAGRKRR